MEWEEEDSIKDTEEEVDILEEDTKVARMKTDKMTEKKVENSENKEEEEALEEVTEEKVMMTDHIEDIEADIEDSMITKNVVVINNKKKKNTDNIEEVKEEDTKIVFIS